MVDYSLNEDFDVHFNEWNDFVVVDDLAEFEDDLATTIDDEMEEIIKFGFTNTAKEKIRLAVTRTARRHDVIDNINEVTVTETINKPETFEVEIVYSVGDSFSEDF